MKNLVRLVLVIIVAIAIAYFFYPEQVRQWTEGTQLQPPTPSTTVYKWKDKEGNTIISDTPPTDNTPYETSIYRHDLNIMPLPEKLKQSN